MDTSKTAFELIIEEFYELNKDHMARPPTIAEFKITEVANDPATRRREIKVEPSILSTFSGKVENPGLTYTRWTQGTFFPGHILRVTDDSNPISVTTVLEKFREMYNLGKWQDSKLAGVTGYIQDFEENVWLQEIPWPNGKWETEITIPFSTKSLGWAGELKITVYSPKREHDLQNPNLNLMLNRTLTRLTYPGHGTESKVDLGIVTLPARLTPGYVMDAVAADPAEITLDFNMADELTTIYAVDCNLDGAAAEELTGKMVGKKLLITADLESKTFNRVGILDTVVEGAFYKGKPEIRYEFNKPGNDMATVLGAGPFNLTTLGLTDRNSMIYLGAGVKHGDAIIPLLTKIKEANPSLTKIDGLISSLRAKTSVIASLEPVISEAGVSDQIKVVFDRNSLYWGEFSVLIGSFNPEVVVRKLSNNPLESDFGWAADIPAMDLLVASSILFKSYILDATGGILRVQVNPLAKKTNNADGSVTWKSEKSAMAAISAKVYPYVPA